MAAWTDYIALMASLASGKAFTDEKAQALAENPVAIAEGAAGAPRIAFAALDTWYTTAGAVGTYAWARRGTGTADIDFGSTIAGSNLVTTSAFTELTSLGSNNAAMRVGAALSGTWRCMGTHDTAQAGSGGGNTFGATLWLRIS